MRHGLLFSLVFVVPSLYNLEHTMVYLALLLLYHPWILGLHHGLLFGFVVVVVPSLDNLQNTESLLSMNNIDICLTTA